MTSIKEGGTTTANVFSGGDKQKIENLSNKINELVARLDIAENKVEGLRIDMIDVKNPEVKKDEPQPEVAALPLEEENVAELVETEVSEAGNEPDVRKDFSGVKGAEEDEPVEKTVKSDKKKSKK